VVANRYSFALTLLCESLFSSLRVVAGLLGRRFVPKQNLRTASSDVTPFPEEMTCPDESPCGSTRLVPHPR